MSTEFDPWPHSIDNKKMLRLYALLHFQWLNDPWKSLLACQKSDEWASYLVLLYRLFKLQLSNSLWLNIPFEMDFSKMCIQHKIQMHFSSNERCQICLTIGNKAIAFRRNSTMLNYIVNSFSCSIYWLQSVTFEKRATFQIDWKNVDPFYIHSLNLTSSNQ